MYERLSAATDGDITLRCRGGAGEVQVQGGPFTRTCPRTTICGVMVRLKTSTQGAYAWKKARKPASLPQTGPKLEGVGEWATGGIHPMELVGVPHKGIHTVLEIERVQLVLEAPQHMSIRRHSSYYPMQLVA